jgi:hypothetical protein
MEGHHTDAQGLANLFLRMVLLLQIPSLPQLGPYFLGAVSLHAGLLFGVKSALVSRAISLEHDCVNFAQLFGQ